MAKVFQFVKNICNAQNVAVPLPQISKCGTNKQTFTNILNLNHYDTHTDLKRRNKKRRLRS